MKVASRRVFHHGLTVADGVVYTVIAGGDDGAGTQRLLRRFDPVQLVVDEVALGMDIPGRCTMAMGLDGLHIAQHQSKMGRAFLSHEVLEAARWRLVENVLPDGFPLPSDDASGEIIEESVLD